MKFDNVKIVEPALRIHPDSLVMFSQCHYTNYQPHSNHNSLLNLNSNFNHNNLSPQAKRKLEKAIKYLIFTATDKEAYNNKTKSKFRFKVNMVTLTLSSSQVHSDQTIKSQCLNQLLLELKQHYSVKNYVWKSEYQVNGNVHFHLLTDQFIPWFELQNRWNRIQNKLGYVDRFKYDKAVKAPNSTDVHSLRKINNVVNYCTKYMVKVSRKNKSKCSRVNCPLGKLVTKSSKSMSPGVLAFLRKLADNGRVWGCSYTLVDLKGGASTLDCELLEEIERLQKEKGSRRIDKDNFSLVMFDNNMLNSGSYPVLSNLLNSFIVEKFGYCEKILIFNEYKPPSSEIC